MIDASQGYMKDGPKNRLRARDIHRIIDVFTKGLETDKYGRMVSLAEIEKNDFNLNLPRYIDSREPEDTQDINGHLHGGIPVADALALAAYWTVCPGLRAGLFRDLRPGYVELVVEKTAIKRTISEHPQFVEFIQAMKAHFRRWREPVAAQLKALQVGFHPKDLIADLSENLLAHYLDKPLIDAYAVYQHLMDFWDLTMQDDCYLLAADGWQATTYRVVETKKGKDGKPSKTVDKGWACDLLPKAFIVARYFAKEQAEIEQLAAEVETVPAQLSELEEEHGGEEGAFAGLDKINKVAVGERLRSIKHDKAAMEAALHGEMDRINQQLTRRVKELAERYATPMPQLTQRVAELEGKVNTHLQKMGYEL